MSLLGDLQQLINEHGSASILKERLELVREPARRRCYGAIRGGEAGGAVQLRV